MTDDPVALATFGLVLATALLVVATAIPALQNFSALRRNEIAAGAQVVPDMNLLMSRIEVRVRQLLHATVFDLARLDILISEAEQDVDSASEMVERSFRVSLGFANEAYVVRHFITSGIDELREIARCEEKTSGSVSSHDLQVHGDSSHHTRGDMSMERRISLACTEYQAALHSLHVAEALLPRQARSVNGTPFWDQYRAKLFSRATQAEKALVDKRLQGRASRPKVTKK